ncbi:hypothetical protein C7B76_16690, partial [filamentous cyanobacterium CCP2]
MNLILALSALERIWFYSHLSTEAQTSLEQFVYLVQDKHLTIYFDSPSEMGEACFTISPLLVPEIQKINAIKHLSLTLSLIHI